MSRATTLSNEWQAFWLALGFLTRLPMLARIDYSQQLMNQSNLYFPLVGLILGGLYVALYSALSLLWSPWICVLLVLCFHLWVTGAFHEDGLADSMDALGGGYSVERRLEIMKDSRIGTYGTVALVLALVLKAALLTEAEPIWLALLLTPVVARTPALLLMASLRYVTDPDQSKSKPVADGFSCPRLLIALGMTLLLVLILTPWHPGLVWWCIGSVAAVTLLWGRYIKSQLGGYTGDTLGASVAFCELVLLMGLA